MPVIRDIHRLYAHALKNKYIIPAFHVWGIESVKAVLRAAADEDSPVIMQILTPTLDNVAPFPAFLETIRVYAEEYPVPVVVNRDHSPSVEAAVKAVDMGFPSVMFDGSSLPFDENVRKTRQVTDYAHERGVWVEAELGSIPGLEDEAFSTCTRYTEPEQASEFLEKTGCDSLAVAVGTAHGGVRAEEHLKIDFERLENIQKAAGKVPLVLHGAAALPWELVDEVNLYGGKAEHLMMCTEETIERTRLYGVAKANMDVDNWLAVTAALRKQFAQKPEQFNPIVYMKETENAMYRVVRHKMHNVSRSTGMAARFMNEGGAGL